MINLTNKKDGSDFTNEDLDMLQAVADQAAVAVNKAQLWEMAFTDSLTGLRDRRYFKVKLQEELQRSRRYHKPFSIVMADLDKLKDINDTHGHAAGDRALKDIGAFFMSQIRDVDIVARYGGDEFILFFPEKGKDAAHHLSERLRNGINHNLTVNSSALSISVGIASYPEDGTDIEALIDKADKAMYQAKRMGRNRIESYSDSTP